MTGARRKRLTFAAVGAVLFLAAVTPVSTSYPADVRLMLLVGLWSVLACSQTAREAVAEWRRYIAVGYADRNIRPPARPPEAGHPDRYKPPIKLDQPRRR